MVTKIAAAFANIFMAKIEKEILRQNSIKRIFWKRFNRWRHISMGHRHKRNRRIPSKGKQLPSYNQVHAAEISETETTFLDTKVYKGVRFNKDSILDVRTHFKPTDIPIHEFVFVSPTRRHKRLHQRRSFKASKNKFLWNHFWREHEEFFNTPQE